MRKADAPPAGWYPDPQHRLRLRWWDGLDWTDIRRAPPSTAELDRAEVHLVPDVTEGFAPRRSMQQGGLTRADADDIIAEVRSVARQEVDRAAEQFTLRTQSAVRSFTPLITEYTNRVVRVIKLAAIIASVLFIAWLVFQAVASQSLFEWIGDRIDNITNRDEEGGGLVVGWASALMELGGA